MKTAAETIQQAATDGVTLRLVDGKLKATGPHHIIKLWSPLFSLQRDAIIKALTPADQLSPAERSLWCLDHQNTWPDGHCPHMLNLERCTLWQAVNYKRTLQ
jgi:hypothetical protein